MTTYRYLVTGRVQGVGYRYFALQVAEKLGVNGFVRNLPDGSVEVIAEAPDDVIVSFEEQLREGPSFASVSDLNRSSIDARGDRGFHIR